MSSSRSPDPLPTTPRAARRLSAETFREACALFATGVTIATVRAADGTPHGLTLSSFTSISIDPPLILISIDLGCPFISHFRSGTHFAVNVLSESQRDLSVTFATKPEGRFDALDWYTRETGAPLLQGCLATIECQASAVIDLGDHAVFVGEVLSAESRPGRPLVYFNREYRSLS